MNKEARLASNQRAADLFVEGIQTLQLAQMEIETPMSVSFKINHNRPIRIVGLGDVHFGSLNTDYDRQEQIVQEILDDPDVYVIFTGDETEGRKKGYLSTNGISTVGSASEHIQHFRTKVLKPLNDAGRVMAVVTDYWGHIAWPQDASTTYPWWELVGDLDVNLVSQGGVVQVEFASGEQANIQIYHNSPGKSKHDPVHGSRNAQQHLDSGTRAGTVFSGHTHRAGVEHSHQPPSTVEKVRKVQGLTSDDPSLVFVQNGTFKSINPGLPQDPFGKKLGLSLADIGAQSTEIFHGSEGKILKYPTLKVEQGKIVHSALTVLNDLERQGMTAEMAERIAVELEDKPDKRFARELSEMGPAGQRDVAWYSFESRLPIRVEFAQNVRYGSGERGIQEYEAHLAETVANNPHVFIALLRNMVDTNVSRRGDRDVALNKLISAHSPYSEQILLLMKDGNLSQTSWGRDIGSREKPKSFAIDPVQYLSSGLSIPSVHNQSTLAITLGPSGNLLHRPTYTTLLLDKLGNNMSTEKPLFGHYRQYDKQRSKTGIIAGGHAIGSGFASRFDPSNPETNAPVAVSSGWWSEFDAMGKGNKGPGAEPGASVILMPGKTSEEYMVFGTADVQESVQLHEALKLYVGLAELGLLSSVSSWASLASER